ECLREYLVNLSRRDSDRLHRLIALHHLSIKALALHDEEFYRLFIDWLPFETNQGTMSLGEYRKRYEVIRFPPQLDQFRQIAHVAAAQGLCILNGGYTYHEELLSRYPEVYPDAQIEAVDASALAQNFEDLSLEEQEQVGMFLRAADAALQPFKCRADLKRF